jgi:UDP-glucose 4-epimerase
MRIVITGGAGFLGRRLALRLLERGTLADARGQTREISHIVLLDVVPATLPSDRRLAVIAGDLSDSAIVERAVTRDTDTVFHLAAVVSGQAEADFDIGMRVNLDATRLILERCRTLASPPKFVFTSSLAVYGGPLPDPVRDDSPVTPQASYGAQKLICEYLVYDMTRKGFIDVVPIIARLPTESPRVPAAGAGKVFAASFSGGILHTRTAGGRRCALLPGRNDDNVDVAVISRRSWVRRSA